MFLQDQGMTLQTGSKEQILTDAASWQEWNLGTRTLAQLLPLDCDCTNDVGRVLCHATFILNPAVQITGGLDQGNWM